MDRVFANYLHEIELAYQTLPKSMRIRIERWVEKLVATGNVRYTYIIIIIIIIILINIAGLSYINCFYFHL